MEEQLAKRHVPVCQVLLCSLCVALREVLAIVAD